MSKEPSHNGAEPYGTLGSAGPVTATVNGHQLDEDDWDNLLARETRAHEPAAEPATPSQPEPVTLANLPLTFWESRDTLTHIRRAAHARGRSADVVFGATLARISAMAPPDLRFDTGFGEASLNFYVAAVGPSGTGKTAGARVARDISPAPRWFAANPDTFRDGMPIGTGEGLVEAYMGLVEQEIPGEYRRDKTPKTRKVRGQVRGNVFVFIDEGETLVKIGERSGATIGGILRSAWNAELLGQANAREETTRLLQPNSYSLGLLVGFQPGTALPVLAEAGPGTPQRFLWVSALDPTVPDLPPRNPGKLPPVLIASDGFPVRGTIEFDDAIRHELWQGNLARVRGEAVDADLDSHGPLLRSKAAALLAILEGRTKVDLDDWALAGQMWETSCAVRDALVDRGVAEQTKAAEARTQARVDQAVQTAAAVNSLDSTLERIGQFLAARIRRAGDLTDGAAKRALSSRDRPLYDAAVNQAAETGLLVRATGGIRLAKAAA